MTFAGFSRKFHPLLSWETKLPSQNAKSILWHNSISNFFFLGEHSKEHMSKFGLRVRESGWHSGRQSCLPPLLQNFNVVYGLSFSQCQSQPDFEGLSRYCGFLSH